ncbi:uncharacterized protein LOC110699422 [Chenopodium quinoa]|uniref:uncharacterized protein LOC110699422 n=1 Tax=Chenopodium quinoa TaxID=63459 RepID=UPI000B77D667|nr:uncharacterized protein LOC110699422 [Chenopodium quinoa]
MIDILMSVSQQNPYAAFFRSLKERDVAEDTRIVLNKNIVYDQRLYNALVVDDVAVIWPDSASSSDTLSPHILVSGKSCESHRIYHNYGCYDPLQYPLLFPRGECGWMQGLKKTYHADRRQASLYPDPIMSCVVHAVEDLLRAKTKHTRAKKFIPPREYYAYRLQIQPNNFLLRAGRCLQQYIVDMYVKIENTRLDYLRNNQSTISVDLYQGILDSLDIGETKVHNVGRRVILPPSFIGGPRDMKKRYLNAMAFVQRFGKHDLFVTMTCNANWPAIKSELAPGEAAQDRPDLVTQIFRIKLLALKREIMEKKVFDTVAAMVYVVDFHKRGLPHAHFLIILKPEFKLKCPADYDIFVCAEIPDTSNPILHRIVLAHMMHGPCGSLNPHYPCMRKEGQKLNCKNKFLRPYASKTSTNKDGYPIYRRRTTGENVTIRGAQLNNEWVIPYNPYLSMLFDCHINVEACSTIKAVKYLYKYVYKGYDRISYNVRPADDDSVDEIELYQLGRWVSPCKAAWRIFGFDLFEMSSLVLPLQVQLPNMQTVHLWPHERLNTVISDSKRSRTQLTEFFAMNVAVESGTGYLYSEFCEHFKWDAKAKEWTDRATNRHVVGRFAFVYPVEGERFFLRHLLLNVRSPTSFENLQTVNGYVCPTFQEAALKLRLVEEDDVADLALTEASEVQHPVALHRLFATVLIFCQKTKDIIDALDAPIPEECLTCRSRLNSAQNAAFKCIMEFVTKGKSGAFFIDDPGDTGKTFLYNALYAEIRLMNKIVLPTTTLSIAAANIPSAVQLIQGLKYLLTVTYP